MKPPLLIVDDDEDIRTQMKWALAGEYEILLAEDRRTAVQLMTDRRPGIVLLDLGLPPRPNEVVEGMDALSEILAIDPLAKVIVISGQGEKENAMRAVGEGAYDFLGKPIETEELQVILRRAAHVARLEREYRSLKDRIRGEDFEQMLGTSSPMQEVFAAIRKVATTDAPVLMLGESGTGKEVAAKAIHRRSRRCEGPFVTINCGAIPATLLESELFGHEKGAFTGAHTQRDGRIEAAEGGSLFLDEIGELPPDLQVKLLRFLQDHTLERVGGRKPLHVDARVFAATNVDMKAAMEEDKFREDLYYRLSVVQIRLPPLRDREGDVVLLAKAFLQRYAAEESRPVTGFSRQALSALQMYDWPGNVRELENRVKRAVIMSDRKLISPADLELQDIVNQRPGPSLREARDRLDRELIRGALIRNHGNVSRAADELEISRPTLYEMMTRLGIERET